MKEQYRALGLVNLKPLRKGWLFFVRAPTVQARDIYTK